MNDCKYCGEANPTTVFNCLKCNAAMPTPAPVQNVPVMQSRPVRVQQPAPLVPVAPEPQFTSTSGKDWLIYFGAAFGFIALVAVMLFFLNRFEPMPAASSRSSSSTTTISDTRRIKSAGGIVVATSEENFAEMMRADDAALLRMSAAGKVFRLQDGTKVRVIVVGLAKSKVTAIDGLQAGRSGWLPNEFIE
jgi:hypothetical protein